VFKDHRLVYHSSLGSRVIKTKKRDAVHCVRERRHNAVCPPWAPQYRGTSLIRNTHPLGSP